MNFKFEIEAIQSDIRKLTDRLHSLEVKIGNTTINSLQNRMTNFQEDIAKIHNTVVSIEAGLRDRNLREFSEDESE